MTYSGFSPIGALHRRPIVRTWTPPLLQDEFGLGGHVKREVEAHLAAVCQADPYLRKYPVRMEWILDADCAEVAADHPFIATFQGAATRAGLDPRLSGFRSAQRHRPANRARADPDRQFRSGRPRTIASTE